MVLEFVTLGLEVVGMGLYRTPMSGACPRLSFFLSLLVLVSALPSRAARMPQPRRIRRDPNIPHPISLLTGTKVLNATDFATADDLLSVSRSYRDRR